MPLIFRYRITVMRKQLLARIPKQRAPVRLKFHAERARYGVVVELDERLMDLPHGNLYIAIAGRDKSVCRVSRELRGLT